MAASSTSRRRFAAPSICLLLAGCAGARPVEPRPAPVAARPAVAPPVVVLGLALPPLEPIHARVRDPHGAVTAACDGTKACGALSGWQTSAGRYELLLDYRAADGVGESFAAPFFSGFGETRITLRFSSNVDGIIDTMLAETTSPPIAGVALRAVGPATYGALPAIELVNASPTAVYVRAQGDRALIGVERLGGGGGPYAACGTGLGIGRVAPGGTMPTAELAALSTRPPRARGRYRVTASYGLDELQELSTTGTREVAIELDLDGPEPEVPAARAASPLHPVEIVERDPGRPPNAFVPPQTDGAQKPRRAPPLALEQRVGGTLTATSSRRYFRVRVPEPADRAAARFYARCDGPKCVGEAYAVLTEDPESVSDARSLRGSGGWTRLGDDADRIPKARSLYLVVGCLRGCPNPVHFSGHAYAWPSEDARRRAATAGALR